VVGSVLFRRRQVSEFLKVVMTITIVNQRAIHGPNVWSRSSVTCLLVDPGSAGNRETEPLSRQLNGLFAGLLRAETTYTPIDPIELQNSHELAPVLSNLILNLQRLSGFDVGFCFARQAAVIGCIEIVVQHDHESIGLAASRLAVRLLNHLIIGSESAVDFETEFFVRFGTLAGALRYGRASRTIIAAAERRGIPVTRNDPGGRIDELGSGAFRRRIHGSITSLTSKIGDTISTDKNLTNHFLRAAGLPVPRGTVVRKLDQAIAAAHTIGYPVVLKPIDQGGSTGVFLDLRNDNEIRTYFPKATTVGKSGKVLVEQYLTGKQYRIVVVDDQVISASLRVPAVVIGDGEHTIEWLIEKMNSDPRRGKRESNPLKKIVVDAELTEQLSRHSFALDDVPQLGQHLPLQFTGDVHRGAMSIDVTDLVHADNSLIARQVTRAVGVDVASIDLIADDITQSIWTTSGAILDVNTASGFVFELYPGEGSARDPGPAIIDMLYPAGTRVRAPIVAVSGKSSSAICMLIAKFLAAAGKAVSTATRDGITIDGMKIQRLDARNPEGFGIVLNNPGSEFIVAEIEPGVVMEEGLGFTYCDVAVVTSLAGLMTPFGAPVENVFTSLCDSGSTLVVNEDEPAICELARKINHRMIVYSTNPSRTHGNECPSSRDQIIVIRPLTEQQLISVSRGDEVNEIIDVSKLSEVLDVSGELSLAVLLPSLAVLIGLGIPVEMIRNADSNPSEE